jgi:O-antigen ligase
MSVGSRLRCSGELSEIIGAAAFLYLTVILIASLLDRHVANNASNFLVLLLPVSIWYFKTHTLSRNEKLFIITGFSVSLYAVVNYFIHPITEHSGPKLEVQAKYALIVAIYFLLHVSRLTIRKFLLMHGLLCIATTSCAVYWTVIYDYDLPVGIKYIPFGNLALLSGSLLLMASVVVQYRGLQVTLFLLFLLGVYSSLASGTRGGWVAFPVMLIWVFCFFNNYIKKQILYFGIATISLAIVGLLVTDAFQVRSTINEGLNNTYRYFNQPGSEVSPIGLRLEMWKAGVLAIKEHPLTGIGIGNTQQWYQSLISEQRVSPVLAQFKHFHNSYIDTLASKGVLGAFFSLLFIGFLFGDFVRQYRRCENKYAAAAGILVLLSYLQFSLTDSFFDLTVTICYFIVCISSLFYLAHGKNN